MKTTLLRWSGFSLVLGAAAGAAGCSDGAPLAPDPELAFSGLRAAPATASRVEAGAWRVDLSGCENLRAPEGTRFVFHAYATGVQIYRWNGTDWSFVGPSAVLSADAGGNSRVGIHYSGPTWEFVSGAMVVASVRERCTPDPDAIPWLLLEAVSSEGPGVFEGVTFIQRVNTVGGNAPSLPGSTTGEEAEVPYTALYLFYRTK